MRCFSVLVCTTGHLSTRTYEDLVLRCLALDESRLAASAGEGNWNWKNDENGSWSVVRALVCVPPKNP